MRFSIIIQYHVHMRDKFNVNNNYILTICIGSEVLDYNTISCTHMERSI